MKTGLLSLAFVLGASMMAQAKGSNDPVLMTCLLYTSDAADE